MKRIFLGCLATFLCIAAQGASAPQQIPSTLQGNWNTVDGGQQWLYGFYPAFAIWENAFWDYAGVTSKGAVTTIQLRERGGDRTATLYARWNPKDSVAMIGRSPKNLTPYSRRIIANPSYRIPADDDPDYPSGDSILRDGIAVVRGYLKGYSPETMARTIKIYGFNTIKNEDLPAVGDIAADGTFEMAVELGHPIATQIVLTGGGYGDLYIEPGDTLMLCYDVTRGSTSELREWYMGGGGRVNHEMSRLKELYAPFGREDQEFLMRTTPDSIRAWVDERIVHDRAATEKYIAENGISRKGAFLARWTPYVVNSESLGLFAMLRERKDPVGRDFYDFYRRLPIDDPRLLGVKSHRFLINRLEFCPVYWKSSGMVALRFSELVRDGFPVDAADFPLIDTLERGLYSVPGDSAATAQAYSRVWQPLYKKYSSFFGVRNMVQEGKQVTELGADYWGRPMPFLNDLIASRRLHYSLQRAGQNVPNRWLAMILSRFTSPYMIATLLDANDALRPVPVAAVAAGPYVPADRGERLLDSLLMQHRGRAVYVDFWSTGCGPCRQGMMESWRLKEKLAGKPVDFVYITSTDQSPEKLAADFIEQNKITGRQIRLTPDEWNILAAKYKINGIPHYMIVGPDGRVANPHYRGYGDDTVRDLLKVAGE